MSTARVLRGAPVAKHIRSEVQTAADQFGAETGARPTLATLLVGGAPASVAYRDPIPRARAVVIGRSNVVGKPMEALLLARDATVTVCHRRTVSLKNETVHGDIVV